MGRDDWYRNEIWDADIEAAFRAKLSRSRSGRPQYLTIQASYLTRRYPKVAQQLIDEYFETDDEFNVNMAHCARAHAFLAMEKTAEAVAAYKQALEWEELHPNHISPARIEFPKLVAECRVASEYDFALEVLTGRFKAHDHAFPSTRYEWNGSNALIAYELGHVVEAQEFAERAVRAAAETESPFRYHRSVGVVRSTTDDFGRRIKRIARPSKLRSLFRLISSR